METAADLKTVEKMEVFVRRVYFYTGEDVCRKPIGCLSAEIHITKNEDKKEILVEVGYGISICNPKDNFSKKRAREISDGRAKKAFVQDKSPLRVCENHNLLKTNSWKINKTIYVSNLWFVTGNRETEPNDLISEKKCIFVTFVGIFINQRLKKICYTPEELAEQIKIEDGKKWMANEVQKIREEATIANLDSIYGYK